MNLKYDILNTDAYNQKYKFLKIFMCTTLNFSYIFIYLLQSFIVPEY